MEMSSKNTFSPEVIEQKNLSEKLKQKCVTDYFMLKEQELEDISLKKSKLVDLAVTASKKDDESGKSEINWNLVAEEKRVELECALEINEQLHEMKNSLLEQIKSYKDKMDEMYTFITYFKEVVQDTTNGTIDETNIVTSSTAYNDI